MGWRDALMLESEPFAAYDDSLADEASVAALAIPPTDGERLMRFRRYRDEKAFAEVVETHAKMVWGVCSQILRHQQDVEDAFQATFLILARKAASIRAADNAAGWLYRVAFRTALLARDRRNRRNEAPLTDDPRSLDDQLAAVERSEQCFALLEELNALPQRYRQPLVLCYMEGRSRREAADEMGITSQTVKGLLARGTKMLRSRLVRRGAALSTSMAAVAVAMTASQASASPTLVSATTALGVDFALKFKLLASGSKGALVKGAAACTLAEKGIVAMTIAAASKPAVGLVGICLAVGMLAVADAEPARKLVLAGGGGENVVLISTATEEGDEAEAEADVTTTAEVRQDVAVNANANVDVTDDTVVTTSIDANLVPGMPADPAAPAAPAVVGAPPAPPVLSSDVPGAMAISVAAAPPSGMPGNVIVEARPPLAVPAIEALPAHFDVARHFNFAVDPIDPFGAAARRTVSVPTLAGDGSVAALKLEGEYWALKAAGLKKKAEALGVKAKEADALKAAGQLPQAESNTLEIAAEVDLTLAEVKLCEMNAQRVRDALEAREKAETTEKGLQTKLDEAREAAMAADQASADIMKQKLAAQEAVADAQAKVAAIKGAVKLRATAPAITIERREFPPLKPAKPVASELRPERLKEIRIETFEEKPDMAMVPKEELKRLLRLAEEMERLQGQLKAIEQEKEPAKGVILDH